MPNEARRTSFCDQEQFSVSVSLGLGVAFREPFKMIYKIVFALVICLGLKSVNSLICHDYVCDANQCYGQGSTCDSGDRPCQVLRKVLGDQEMTTFTCSTMSECISSAGNTTYDGLVMNLCCNTDLCNDGLKGAPIEENKKYCYNTACVGVGCTDQLISYLDEYKIGAFCEANEFGCERTKVEFTDPDTGEVLSEEIMGCSSSPCFPVTQTVDEFKVSMSCCADNLCNGGKEEFDPDADYCHVYTCVEAPCLSVAEAAAQGQTGSCKMTEKGCYFSNTTNLNTGDNIITAGCIGQSSFMAECEPQSLSFDDIMTETHCCDSNQCNSGQLPEDNAEVDPNKQYCHVYECLSHSCVSLSYAVKLGKTSLCEMTSSGCFATTVTSPDSLIIHSGCAGQSPVTECIPTSVTVDDTHTRTTCCNKDRCNNGNVDTGDSNSEIDPNKNYCHTYSCVSSPDSPCLSLAEAIKQGVSSVCEMTEKGCLESSSYSDGQLSILAGCTGHEHMTADCDEMSVIDSGHETIQKCCDTDRCNNGDKRGQSENKPYCHMYSCTSDGGSCLPLAEAVLLGKTARCEKTDKGCFAMSDNGKFIEAGCIGGMTGVDECPKAPPMVGGKVVCCNTSGCNDALYEETDTTDLDSGATINGLFSMMAVLCLPAFIALLL